MRTNLASVVGKQLPEFIREDYQGFTAFVEAYYNWLNDQQISLEDSRDLDYTLDTYIQYFKKELAVHLPNLLEDDRTVLPRIKDLYLAKGSEASFKLLFRLMFGKPVELVYPGQQMLKASDGTWNQELSVFARVDYGNPDIVIGKLVDIVSGARVIRVLVDRREVLTGEVDRIVALGGNVYEFYLDKRFFGDIKVGDKIRYKDVFQAEILPATQKPKVQQPGKGFRVGQVFEVNSGSGTGVLVKITQVDTDGGVKYAEIIKFGIGYSADFGVQILPAASINNKLALDAPSFSSLSGTNLNIVDRTPGFDEQGYINYADWASYEYVDATYAGTVIREFALNYRNAGTVEDNPCQLGITLGALVRYPGYYTSNNGFLDDSVKIQDSYYYQKYSYVIKIDQRLATYKAAVKSLLHPSGMALFGEYNIENKFDLSVALECVVKALGIGLQDSIEDLIDDYLTRAQATGIYGSLMTSSGNPTLENGPWKATFFTIGKAASDEVTMTHSVPVFNFGKALSTHKLYGGVNNDTSSVSMTEAATRQFTKALSAHYLYDGLTLDGNSVSMTHSAPTFSVGKSLGSQYLFGGLTLESTSVAPADSLPTFDVSKALSTHYLFGGITADANTVSMTDTNGVSLNIGKALSDSSIGTLTNSGCVWMNSYQGQDYFICSEEYSVGLQTTFTN